MIEVMKENGCNGYKIPHINKGRLEQESNLPMQLSVPTELVKAAEAHLQN